MKLKKDKLVTFNYITDLKVNNHNIESIIVMGRRRWKIENKNPDAVRLRIRVPKEK